MIRYKSVEKEAHAEQVIERSRFIAHMKPCSSREEAEEYIRSIKAQYKDATHNVPCFIVGEKQELMWASDDGEPAGTSGAPMMQMLSREGLTNLVCVVTRYFGGIKLGTGGLVRAYTSSARMALDAAVIHEVRDLRAVRIRIPYTLLGKLQNMEQNLPFVISDIEYTDCVLLTLTYAPEDEGIVMPPIVEMTAGKPDIISAENFLE